MSVHDNVAGDESEKVLCCDCTGDEYLSEKIRDEGEVRTCSYCQEDAESFLLDEVADLVQVAFDSHYIRSSPEPDFFESALARDPEIEYFWERKGYPVLDVIEGVAQVDTEIAEDILAILEMQHEDIEAAKMGEESEFDAESYYEEKSVSDEDLQSQWSQFERVLKTETRFFSPVGARFLGSLFNDIDEKETTSGKPLVVIAGPDTSLTTLYRARVFQSELELKEALKRPDIHLGPPPAGLARAGRMNAHGISVFYGANDAETALGETRPPVGSMVAVAPFEITRPIKLLDISSIEDIVERGSLLDPTNTINLAKAKFLHTLKEHIIRPVMPNDELTEYLSTQAVTDFLATEATVKLDGIIYPSVQTNGNGFNVVLFHQSSLVQKLYELDNANVSAEAFPDAEYPKHFTVFYANKKTGSDTDPNQFIESLNFMSSFDSDLEDFELSWQPPTLRIDHKNIEIHDVEKIEVKTSSQPVNWYFMDDDEL